MEDDPDDRVLTARVAPAGAATQQGDGAAGDAPSVEFMPTLLTETRVTDGDGESTVVVLPAAGYQLQQLIGRGGMGEVVAAHDQRIGRQVALKRMRGEHRSADATGRFLREARIQARLDHPAIVPVHELGIDGDGNPYFTMKRVAGMTLAERLAEPDRRMQPMLRAFVDVCLAMDLAHSRGVVHRDLKPANIILGDYGEVYVLDWGIARVMASKRATTSGGGHAEADLMEIETQVGSMLGTPGYMAPEQMRDSATVDAAADVYALGSILFEILAGEPLHPRGEGALASTLTGAHPSPSQRRPERNIPLELDAVCGDAISDNAADRPTARQLADRVQHYLDGDRDVERRRALAADQLAIARAAIDSEDPAMRGKAIHAAGRALALHPESVEAAELVTRVIVEPPRKHPPELEAQLQRSEADRARSRARNGFIAYLLILALTALFPLIQVKSYPLLAFVWIAIASNLALAFATMKLGLNRTRYVIITSGLMALALSRVASPLILVPAVICGSALSVASTPWMSKRVVRPLIWSIVLGMLPYVLEWTGVFASTMTPETGRLVITSAIFKTHGYSDFPVLLLGNLGFIVIVVLFVHGVVRDRRRAERKVEIQAWHLGQLLPTQAPRTDGKDE